MACEINAGYPEIKKKNVWDSIINCGQNHSCLHSIYCTHVEAGSILDV